MSNVKLSHWVVIWQPRDAEQFDFKTMKVVDCWRGRSEHKTAYDEMTSNVKRYLDEHGDGKISLLEGDRQANYLWPFMEAS